MKEQLLDGRWSNPEDLVKEDDPLIATPFALRALCNEQVRLQLLSCAQGKSNRLSVCHAGGSKIGGRVESRVLKAKKIVSRET